MIIRMGRPFANDHPDGLAFCKWLSGFLPFNQFLFHLSLIFKADFLCSSKKIVFSFKTFLLLLQIFRSRFNLADFSRKFYSCSYSLGKQNSCMSVLQIKSFIDLFNFHFQRCKNADTSYPELQRLHCEVPLPSFRSIIYYLPCKPRLILHKSLQAKGQNHTTSTSGRRSSPRRSKKGCGAS